jgi:hypothetical protein
MNLETGCDERIPPFSIGVEVPLVTFFALFFFLGLSGFLSPSVKTSRGRS